MRLHFSRLSLFHSYGETVAYCCFLLLVLLNAMPAAALTIEAMISTIGTIMLVPVLARLLFPLVSAGCDDGLPVSLSATYPDPLSLEDSPEAFNGLSGVGSNSELLSVA